MTDFDQFINHISFGDCGDFEGFRISKMMRDFLDLTIDDFSGITFTADKDVMQRLYQASGKEDALTENDTEFFRSGYGSKYYLDTIGVSEDNGYIHDMLTSLYEKASYDGCLNVRAIRLLAYPLMKHNADAVASPADQLKNTFANTPVEDIYRNIGEGEYYDKWLSKPEEYCRKQFSTDRMLVKHLMSICYDEYLNVESYGIYHVKEVDGSPGGHWINYGISEAKLWDETLLGKPDPSSLISTRATWIWDLIVFMPLKYSEDKRFQSRPVPSIETKGRDPERDEKYKEYLSEKGMTRYIYILSKDGREYSDEECRSVSKMIRKRIDDSREFEFISGSNLNDPDTLYSEILKDSKCYVVVSREDGISILNGELVDILSERLSTTVGLTSWQIACRLVRYNTV